MEEKEVEIRRQERSGTLEEVAEDWAWLDEIAGTFSDDFFAEGRQQPEEQERPALDTLFDTSSTPDGTAGKGTPVFRPAQRAKRAETA